MDFSNVFGQEFIKNHLKKSASEQRIAHAQLFVGKFGYGLLPMALAYAKQVLCNVTTQTDDARVLSCELKCDQLTHPDVHFVYPVATNSSIKSHPVSSLFVKEWRTFVQENAYADVFDWHNHIDISKKQGIIAVDEARDLNKAIALKSYEGGYKICVIWAADKMNIAAANKLLKLIEEPPKKTLFLLLTENEDHIIDTIKSRCQTLHFPPLSEQIIAEALIELKQLDAVKAKSIARQANGDLNNALKLINHSGQEIQFEEWFVNWVRTAFIAKTKKEAVITLINWAEELAKTGRETQKNFIQFCVEYFRQALLFNYGAPTLVFIKPQTQFSLEKFAPFIHGNNINEIVEELENSAFLIERNGNAKIIFTDLAIKLTRLIHAKEL